MPWLVVEGAGSWCPSLGREWVDDPKRHPPPFAPLGDDGHPKCGYWRDRAKTYKAGAHRVDEEVARQAANAGFAWLIVMPDENEPVIETVEHPTGMLTPDDIREGKGAGVRLVHVVEGEHEVEPEPERTFEHVCRWCPLAPPRTFPSPAALARHIEFEHPTQFEMGHERAVAAAQAIAEEQEALRRVADHDKPVPVWEREAVTAAGLPPAVEPEPTIPLSAPS